MECYQQERSGIERDGRKEKLFRTTERNYIGIGNTYENELYGKETRFDA